MSDITERVGELIKQARKAKGLTQKELGKMIGIGEATVNKYEKGKINPSLQMLDRIAKELGLTLEVKFN